MAAIILLYTLKEGVTQEQYDHWIRNTDYPAMRGLARVKSYINYRTVKPLFGEGKPSASYVEVFDIPDLEGFLQEDLGGSVVQQIMGEFMQYVENPEFILAEAVV
ncbi:MAG: REDY-like protein HapK [Chthonomonadales bacterium]|nr:REDY-like protein HapK [Chthonomonadales bacterium]